MKKAENYSLYCFYWWKWPHVICLQFLYYLYVNSQLCSLNIQNMVHDKYLVLFSFLCCPLDAGFHLWENAAGELEVLSGQKFPHRNEENPALELSNVHNRTSARDGPMFGSMGPSMNTSSLGLRTHATVYCIRMQHNGINTKITMHSYCRLISNYTHNTWPPLWRAYT